jgi:hypothetical protein
MAYSGAETVEQLDAPLQAVLAEKRYPSAVISASLR